jgi:hypothetical protein
MSIPYNILLLFSVVGILKTEILINFPLGYQETFTLGTDQYDVSVYRQRLQNFSNLSYQLDEGQLTINITTETPLTLQNCYNTYLDPLVFQSSEGSCTDNREAGCRGDDSDTWNYRSGVCRKSLYASELSCTDVPILDDIMNGLALYWFGYRQYNITSEADYVKFPYFVQVCQCVEQFPIFFASYTLTFKNGSSLTNSMSQLQQTNDYWSDKVLWLRFFTLNTPKPAYWVVDYKGSMNTGLVNGITEFQIAKFGLVKENFEINSILLSGLLESVNPPATLDDNMKSDDYIITQYANYDPLVILDNYLQITETLIADWTAENLNDCSGGPLKAQYFNSLIIINEVARSFTDIKINGVCYLVVFSPPNPPTYYHYTRNVSLPNTAWYEFTVGMEAHIINDLTEYNITCNRASNGSLVATTNHPESCFINGTILFPKGGFYSPITTDSMTITCNNGLVLECPLYSAISDILGTQPQIGNYSSPVHSKPHIDIFDYIEVGLIGLCCVLILFTLFFLYIKIYGM